MKRKKSERGYTGIDIAISVVVLFIFVSLLAVLSYHLNSSSKEIELKGEAIAIAVDEIETLKNTLNFDEIKNLSVANGNSEYTPIEEVQGKEGFYRKITIQDYADQKVGKTPGIVKKVIVQVQYMFQGKKQTVELSTIMSNES